MNKESIKNWCNEHKETPGNFMKGCCAVASFINACGVICKFGKMIKKF